MADPFAPEFVNREPQVDAFEQILAGTLNRRVFLIEGDAEIGKSFLLDQFLHMAGRYHYSRLDFRDGEPHTFLSLIHAAMRDLGVDYFDQTRAEIYRLTQGARHDIQVHGEEIHEPEPVNWGRWRLMLVEYFSENDLKDLSFDLQVDYESLPAEGKDGKARELLAHMKRVGRHMELLDYLGRLRPNAPWHELISQTPAEGALPGPDGGRFDVYKSNHFLPPMADPFQQYALEQQISLTFLDELQLLARENPVVLSYDSYESAPIETQRWLKGLLLDELAREHIPGVIVLISGRKILEVTRLLEPLTVQTRLANFDLATVTEYWVHRQGLPADAVSGIYEETAGHPKKIADKAIAAGGKHFTSHLIKI